MEPRTRRVVEKLNVLRFKEMISTKSHEQSTLDRLKKGISSKWKSPFLRKSKESSKKKIQRKEESRDHFLK
jgi:hypothetical protein